MKKVKLFRELARRFPKNIKDPNDHVGLMTGKMKNDIQSILLCLDFDDIVYEQIKDLPKYDLILTHHPFIYGTRAKVLKRDPIKQALVEKIDALGIPVYSMHTNFDTGKDGMNDALAKALGLQNIVSLETCKMARGGELKEEMDVNEFAKYAIDKLGLDYAHLIHAGKEKVKRVAILGGGGAYKYRNACAEGYDIFISGDVPHHIRREVIANKFNFLDVNHEVEKIFMPQMKKILLEIDPTLKVDIINHEDLPTLITK